MPKLDCKITNTFSIHDPFMIASSHHTDNENSFDHLSEYAPSAVTLKTISNKHGGGGNKERERGIKPRDKVILRYPGGNRMGSFTDGPKKLELWDTPTCLQYLQLAKRLLPNTKIGLSVAQGEEYEVIARSFDLGQVDFVELNWKYTFRNVEFAQQASIMLDDLTIFLNAFSSLQAFVKIPSELLPHLTRNELRSIYALLSENSCAVIVANTKKAVVPPSRQPDKTRLRDRGVVFGEQLFLDTFNGVRALHLLRENGWAIPTIIATGGITDIGAVIDLLATGADAVQLCSILDYRKLSAIDILRRQLQALMADANVYDLEEFKRHLRNNGDQNKYWLEVAQNARSLEPHHETILRKISSNKKSVLEGLGKTLKSESLELLSAHPSSEPKHMLPGPAKMLFLINRSNLVAFILSHRVIRDFGFSGETVDDSQEVRTRLQKKVTPEFDLAILPRRVAEAILDSLVGTPAEKSMRIVGNVGYSKVEIVGALEPNAAIRNLFHFSGTGSKEALKHLLPQLSPKPILREIESPREELSPLLSFWNDRDAILARGPLTGLYALLANGETRKKWKVIHSTTDDLVLVATTRLPENADAHFSAQLLLKLQSMSWGVNQDPVSAAREAYDLGYMNHIANLFGANVLA